jgi:hypothetical protein
MDVDFEVTTDPSMVMVNELRIFCTVDFFLPFKHGERSVSQEREHLRTVNNSSFTPLTLVISFRGG